VTYNLWKIQRIIAYGIEDKILELVDSAEKLVAQRSHGGWLWSCGSLQYEVVSDGDVLWLGLNFGPDA